MRVLLTQSYTRNLFPVFPIGLAYVASSIKNEHDVQALDLNILIDPWSRVAEKMEAFGPDIVGISLRNVDSTEYAGSESYFWDFARLVKMVKGIKPDTKVIVGGSGFSIYAEYIMDRLREIDIGVYLEGEYTVKELLADMDNADRVKGCFIRSNKGGVSFTGHREFLKSEEFLRPSYDFFDLQRYVLFKMGGIGIQTKRGCGFKCGYCPYPFLEGPLLRLREPSDVVDEIEFIVKNYNIRNFTFVDSIFNAPLPHAVNICEEIVTRKLNIRWAAYTSVKGFTEEYARVASTAGCVAFPFSVDAFSDTALRALGKCYTQRDVLSTLDVAKKMKGIHMGYSFFLDPPEATVKDFFSLVRFLFRVRKELKVSIRRIFNINRIRIEPHTAIYEIAVQKGIITRDTDMLKPVFYSEPKMKPITIFFDILFFFLSPLVRLKRFLQYKLEIKPKLKPN